MLSPLSMRVSAFRVWFSTAVSHARRAGLAISRKFREAVDAIQISVGVGDDESGFGGQGHRAWLHAFEESFDRMRRFFEESSFERLYKLENAVRGWLGLPPRIKSAPTLPLPPSKAKTVVQQKVIPQSKTDPELLRQVRQGIIKAHTRENVRGKDHS
jgi:hypothetical protein